MALRKAKCFDCPYMGEEEIEDCVRDGVCPDDVKTVEEK